MKIKRRKFKDMMCVHNVSFSGYRGKTQRAIVFTNFTPPNSFIWITTTDAEFVEGQIYNFTAECDGRGILKRVKIEEKSHLKVDIDEEVIDSWNAMNASEKSEQPDTKNKNPVDVFNLIYDIKEWYTLDF